MSTALPRVGGDLTLFHRLVARLIESYDAAWLSRLSQGEPAEIGAEMHKLRGSAALLSATRVEAIAAQVEMRMRQCTSSAEVTPQLQSLGVALHELRETAALLRMSAPNPQPGSAIAPVMSPQQAAERLEALLLLLHQHDLGAGDEWATLRPWLQACGMADSELDRIHHSIGGLDFGPAREALLAWRESAAGAPVA